MSAECDIHGVDLHGDMFSGLVCPLCEADEKVRAAELARDEARAQVARCEMALRPFALAYEQRDDDSEVGGPPAAVQVAGQTHGDDPWKMAAAVLASGAGDTSEDRGVAGGSSQPAPDPAQADTPRWCSHTPPCNCEQNEAVARALSAEAQLERLREALEAIQGECYLWQQSDSPYENPADLIEYLRRQARSALSPSSSEGGDT